MSPIESLLKLAGERDRPSAEAFERARAAALESWRRGITEVAPRRRTPRRAWLYACAAGAAAIAFVLGAVWRREVPAAVEIARVSALQGDVVVRGAGSPRIGLALRTGDVLRTASGRVALTVGDALSLRVDRDTSVRFDGAGHVTLLDGGVYVDSGGLVGRARLRIDTPAGAVSHVGTQYQVRVLGAGTRVQVREGRVVLARAGAASIELGVGDLARVDEDGPHLEHGAPPFGGDWEWAAATAPGFDIENRPLSEFLAWLAREHGWRLRVSDDALQARIQQIRLHGSIEGLDAGAMLERVSLITGVPLAAHDGVLWVGAGSAS